MHLNIKTLLINYIILSFLFGCNQSQEKQKLNDIQFEKSISQFNVLRKDLKDLENVSGMSLVIIRPDTTIIWDFGNANDSSMFRVGSISKSFAGLSILKLAEEGKMSLDAKLDSLAPELNIENSYGDTKPVLVRHLIEASAGFPGFQEMDSRPDPNVSEIKQTVLENPFPFVVAWPPGEFASYDNFGPVITAYLVEKISGMKYHDFVGTHFFNPLDMTNSTFLLDEKVKKNLVDYTDSTYRHIRQRPSGALNSSTREFIHFLQMLLNNGSYNGNRILSKESIGRFESSTSNLASRKLNLTLGHAINNWTVHYNGVNYNGHGGNMAPQYTNFYAYSRKFKTAFVFMASKTNRVRRKDAAEITQKILPYLHPVIPEKSINAIPKDDENKYLGCYRQITKTSFEQPVFEVRLERDSIGNLILIDNNFDSPPHKKILYPTNTKHVYIDKNPENNTSVSGQALYALLENEEGERILQKISLSHEGYEKTPCE